MSLVGSLRQLGLRRGDVVMVHASLRAVGGRAEAIVTSLLETLGPEGTLLAYVDFEPTPEIPDFDLARSPAATDHGVLAEVIRRWPGAIRSVNPGASVSALGARAAWFCADHPMNYGYGPGSPFAKLVEVRGHVLLLGSHFNHVTLLHHAEHLARIPNKRVITYTAMGAGGSIEIEEFDTSDGVVDAMPHDYFERVVRAFVDRRCARTGYVGAALSYLLPAAELVEFAIREMERDFG